MNGKNLASLFNKFVGKEVPLKEQVMGAADFGNGEIVARTALGPANENDPVLQEMAKVAESNGLKMAVSFPGGGTSYMYSMTTTELFNLSAPRADRVNVAIEKAADGKYRVSNKFNIG